MRRQLVLIAAMSTALMMVGVGCEKKPKLDTDVQKASYAIGQQIGNNLKTQSIEFDADVLATSIKEASQGKESRLKPEEMQQALTKMQETLMKKQSEKADKNKSEGTTFLEKNKAAAGVKTSASGLQYTIEKEGAGKTPALTDNVKAHYKGTLINGEKFDSSYDRGQPAEFPVSGVIKGWTEALQMMKVGGKMKLFVPPDLGYGASERPGIPANSVLVFEVELMDVVAGNSPPKAAPSKKR